MLVAPIFHTNYRSPKIPTTQSSLNDNSSSPSASSLSKSSDGQSAKKYNIFKTALNKGINFLSKIANSSPSSSNTSTGSKCQSNGQCSSKSASTESTTPSDCSSPDSLMTELIFFKPICREPKTPSSNKPNVLVRVPSIRSDASSTTDPVQISSPCPSPFFIPITPKRRLNSAFSFVRIEEEQEPEDENRTLQTRVVRPRASVKRKLIELSPKKPEKLPKKVKIESTMPKKTESRTTRSMYKSSSFTDIAEVAQVNKKIPQPIIIETFLKPASARRVIASRKSMDVPVATSTRVLRSRCFKQ